MLGESMKVVLVSDSQGLARDISLFLKVRWPGLSLLSGVETKEVIELIHGAQPDIVMIDHGTPSLDCFDLISQVRSFSDVPLVVLGQDSNAADEVRALEMGADDWIGLTSVSMQFIARVNAILRRYSGRVDRESYFLGGKLTINYLGREVFVSGRKVRLSPTEYRILCYLAGNHGRVVSCDELLRHVWGPFYEGEKEILKRTISRLRSKIEEDPAIPDIVRTERGAGYIIVSQDAFVPFRSAAGTGESAAESGPAVAEKTPRSPAVAGARSRGRANAKSE